VGWQEGVERGGGGGVGGVEADSEDEVVVAVRIGGVYKDAADFDVFFLWWLGGILCIYVVWPFQFHGYIFVAYIVGMDALDDCYCS